MKFIFNGLVLALLLCTSSLLAQISVSIEVVQDISCNGGNNGSLKAVVTPVGTAYTYSWSNGGNTATITGLTADIYVVTVQNAAGGTAIATAVLSEPDELILTPQTELPLIVNPTGTVEVETTGGTAPYAFEWVDESNNPFSNEEDLVNAPAGIYSQTATDANGCTAVLTPVELTLASGTGALYEPTLKIFPNPASKDLVLEIPEGESVGAQVFNVMGQLVETQMLQGARASMVVESWPAGWYSIVIPALNKSAKVLVEH